jgi:hypothetical protein
MHTVNTQTFSDSYFVHGFTIFLVMGIFSALYVGLGILFQQGRIEAMLHRKQKLLGAVIIIGTVVALSLLLNPAVEARVLLMMNGIASASIQLAVVQWLLVSINAVCLVVGMMMCFHAEVLARLESGLVQWIEVRRHPAMIENIHGN